MTLTEQLAAVEAALQRALDAPFINVDPEVRAALALLPGLREDVERLERDLAGETARAQANYDAAGKLGRKIDHNKAAFEDTCARLAAAEATAAAHQKDCAISALEIARLVGEIHAMRAAAMDNRDGGFLCGTIWACAAILKLDGTDVEPLFGEGFPIVSDKDRSTAKASLERVNAIVHELKALRRGVATTYEIGRDPLSTEENAELRATAAAQGKRIAELAKERDMRYLEALCKGAFLMCSDLRTAELKAALKNTTAMLNAAVRIVRTAETHPDSLVLWIEQVCANMAALQPRTAEVPLLVGQPHDGNACPACECQFGSTKEGCHCVCHD